MTEMIPTWIDGDLVPVEKLEAHRRGLRHKAVSVFVLNGDAVLIQRRALGKYHTPGLWANTCCTHPHWDEVPLACAHRRLDEELGLRDLPLKHCGQVEYRADVGGGLIEHELVEVFAARVAERIAPVPNPDEVMAVEWVTRAALVSEIRERPSLFTPWLRIYLQEHAPQIFADAGDLPRRSR